jgi:hypothetical protein
MRRGTPYEHHNVYEFPIFAVYHTTSVGGADAGFSQRAQLITPEQPGIWGAFCTALPTFTGAGEKWNLAFSYLVPREEMPNAGKPIKNHGL